MIMAQNIKSVVSSDVTSSVNPSPISTNRLRGFFCNSPTVLHYIISLSFSAGLSLPVSLNQGPFCPLRGYLTMSGDVIDFHNWRRRVAVGI